MRCLILFLKVGYKNKKVRKLFSLFLLLCVVESYIDLIVISNIVLELRFKRFKN